MYWESEAIKMKVWNKMRSSSADVCDQYRCESIQNTLRSMLDNFIITILKQNSYLWLNGKKKITPLAFYTQITFEWKSWYDSIFLYRLLFWEMNEALGRKVIVSTMVHIFTLSIKCCKSMLTNFIEAKKHNYILLHWKFCFLVYF